MSPLLTDPWPLRGRLAPARVLFGPHETNLGDGRALSDRHVAYYAARAAGGCGVVVTETASVHADDHPYERAPLAAACGPGWAAVADACRPHGTLVLASLGHSGSQGSTAYSARVLWGPSAAPDPVSRACPATMGRAETAAVVDGFAAATALALDAGLDGVEVDAGQHALLRQFLSGLTHPRPSSELLRAVLVAVRAAAGDGIVGLRLCCDELAPWAGITPASAAPVLDAVAGLVDHVVPVRGSGLSVAATRPDLHTPPGVNRDLSSAARSLVDGRCAVVWQGSVADAAFAQDGLDHGVADAVEMTRAQIADPGLVALVRAGTPERVRPCTLSGRWSAGRDPRNVVVSDDAEPRSGHETTDPPLVAAAGSGTALVVGGGPAGSEAARTLALRGHRVRLVDAGERLGGALRLAAALPGRDRFELLADWWERELDRLGVDVVTGRAATAAELDDARRRGVAVLLATGSRPRPPGFAAGPDVECVPVAELVARGWALPAGADVVVADPVGDAVAIGVAEHLAVAGHRCTLATPDPAAGTRLGPGADLPGAHARLLRAGVTIAAFTQVRAAGENIVELVDVHTGAVRTVPCGVVVDCARRLPDDTLWTARPDLPRAGDCVAPRGIHEAVREGRRAALAIDAELRGAAPSAARPRAAAGPEVRDAAVGEGAAPRAGAAGVAVGARPEGRPEARGAVEPRRGTGAAGLEGRPAGAGGDPADPLFAPLPVGPLRLRNRIVFAAHLTGYAEDGRPGARHVAYYAARAAGGAGLVVTEEHAVHPADRPYERMIRGHDPRAVDAYRRLTDAVHAHGVPVLAQLNHNGPQSSGLYSREPVWGPSAVPDPMFREVPVAMTAAMLDELVASYFDVATRCAAGGFDGVELQCSQASILRAFLAPGTNLRTDGYGGSLRRRARLLREVVAAVRAALGPGRALGVRLGGGEDVAGGLTVADAVEVARLLAATGHVDYLSTSTGLATATLHLVEAPTPVPAGYQSALSTAVRRAVAPLPVLGAGRYTHPDQARRALDDGVCDLVGVVRGQIADPGFGGPAPVRVCIGCNQECTGRVGLNRPLRCTVNPRAGREARPVPAPRRRHRVLVVGAGPAGLRAAATAAARGHRVTLVERGQDVGGSLALVAAAPGRGELGQAVEDLLGACVRAGVEIRTSTDAGPELVRRFGADEIVLATGADPVRPPWAGGLDRYGDVVDVLDGRFAPTGSIVVVDETGFHEATSVAELLAARGAAVQVVTPAMVVGQDLGPTLDRPGSRRRAHAAGITSATDRVVTAAATRDGRVVLTVLHHPTGVSTDQRCDAVVGAVAPRPADALWQALRDTDVRVHRIGDCLAPRRAAAAIADGERVGELIGGPQA